MNVLKEELLLFVCFTCFRFILLLYLGNFCIVTMRNGLNTINKSCLMFQAELSFLCLELSFVCHLELFLCRCMPLYQHSILLVKLVSIG